MQRLSIPSSRSEPGGGKFRLDVMQFAIIVW